MSVPEPLHPAHLTSKTDAELAAMQEDLQAAEDRYLRLSQWYGEMTVQVMQERTRRIGATAQKAGASMAEPARREWCPIPGCFYTKEDFTFPPDKLAEHMREPHSFQQEQEADRG